MARNKPVGLHFSEEEYDWISEHAELSGKKVSEWSRDVVLERLNGGGPKRTTGGEAIELALEALMSQGRANARFMADLFNNWGQGKLSPEAIKALWDKHKILRQNDAEEMLKQVARWKDETDG